MKKIAAYTVILMLLISLCSCGKSKTVSNGPAPVYGNFSSADGSAAVSEISETKPLTAEPKATVSEKSESPASQHTHSFGAATCSEAAACACGAASGEKASHNINSDTGKCTVCGVTEFNLKNAVAACLKNADRKFGNEFTNSKIINVYYSESDKCICEDSRPDNKITVFIHYYYTLDSHGGYNIDIYDVHLTENGYEPCFTYNEAITVPKSHDVINSITIKSGNISYSGASLKKADLS